MKIVIDKMIVKDCRTCVNAVKDKNQNVIGCRNKNNCNYEERI